MDQMEHKDGGGACGSNCGNCKCPHHSFIPILVILLGLTFFLGNFEVLSERAVSIVWPVIVILVGCLKLGASKCKCC